MASTPPAFDALDVLARSGEERDAFCQVLGGEPDDDGLLRAVCAVGSAPGRERLPVRELHTLAAVARALDACAAGRISLAELRTGLAVFEASSDGFSGFGTSRPLVRSLHELVRDAARPERLVLRQVGLVHGHLYADLAEQLTGDPGALRVPERPPSSDGWRERFRADGTVADELEGLADEWLDHAAGGPRRAIWVRGWAAVPVLGDALGEDTAELAGIVRALRACEAHALLQVKLHRPSRYAVHGTRVEVGARRRAAYAFPPTEEGAARATAGDRGWCLFTTLGHDFVVLEQLDHHVVAGPRALVDELCGVPAPEALASFREAVETMASMEEDPPEHLLEACQRYAHGRRRST